MITEKEKHIYNSFLYASRKAKNKPVRLRQNFDSLTSHFGYNFIKILGIYVTSK